MANRPILRPKDFARRQLMIALVFFAVVLCAKWLPEWVSANRKGEIYQNYYENALPFSLFEVLIAAFFVRLLLVSIVFWIRRSRATP